MINLKEWPTDYKMHAGCTSSSDEFAPYMGPATVTLTFEQYALAAKAVRVWAQMEEKELPDSEGWWVLWNEKKVVEIAIAESGPLVKLEDGFWRLCDRGRWIKIPTPEEVR